MVSRIPELLKKYENDILGRWVELQLGSIRNKNLKESELKQQSVDFLRDFREAVQRGALNDINCRAARNVCQK
jgi:hypothetical protein